MKEIYQFPFEGLRFPYLSLAGIVCELAFWDSPIFIPEMVVNGHGKESREGELHQKLV